METEKQIKEIELKTVIVELQNSDVLVQVKMGHQKYNISGLNAGIREKQGLSYLYLRQFNRSFLIPLHKITYIGNQETFYRGD